MVKKPPSKNIYPIKHWSYSSLTTFLRNPLAWQKRYVEQVYDLPSSPASIIGRAGHKALEMFYTGIGKEEAVELGRIYLKNVPDFEIDFGKATSLRAKKEKRKQIEREYLQAIGFYLQRAPRHKVVGVEVMGVAKVKGLPLPLKAISDLVVESKGNPGALDIIDHKFVASFTPKNKESPMFMIQALFNYYTVSSIYKTPIKRFMFQECKKRKNKDGSSQLRKHTIYFDEASDDFDLFHRLIKDASAEIARRRIYLPNPSDMFEGDNSFDIYRLGL